MKDKNLKVFAFELAMELLRKIFSKKINHLGKLFERMENCNHKM